jgi:hypothetical protein
MLDNKLKLKLRQVVNHPDQWEALTEYLNQVRTLELQGLVTATSELEVYRKQGKVSLVDNLLRLKEYVNSKGD